MWQHAGFSSLETLAPRNAADRHSLYGLIRDALGVRFPTRGEAVARAALISVRHLSGGGHLVLIRGPSGSGGGTIVRRLARILDLPFLEVDTGASTETNWAGVDLHAFS